MSASPRPVPFAFSSDFGSARQAGRLQELEAEVARLREEVAAAEQRGYDSGRSVGYVAGQRDAEAEAARRVATANERMAEAVGRLLDGLDAERDAMAREAVDVALAAARRFASTSLRRQPTAVVEELFATCVAFARGAPHLVIRVAPDLVEASEPAIKRLAHEKGFGGRIVVLGDPDTGLADATLEWADGGVSRSRAAIEAAIERAVEAHFATPTTANGEQR